MVKARVGLQIKEAFVGQKQSLNNNANLETLKLQFQKLKQQIRQLIEALRAQHLSLLRMNETRLLVAQQIAAIAEGSPLDDQAGNNHSGNSVELESYMAVHYAVSARQKTFAERFMKHIVEYTIEWERVIVARVSSSLKTSDALRRDLDHYQGKVESIRLEVNKVMTKGKMVDTKLSTRMRRNEEKFIKAKGEYQAFVSDLCVLMEEVTVRSWKDLHPILLKSAQFDFTLAADENTLFANLNGVSETLKEIAVKHGLKPQARLADLQTLSAKVFHPSHTLQQSLSGDVTPALPESQSYGSNSQDAALVPPSAFSNNDVYGSHDLTSQNTSSVSSPLTVPGGDYNNNWNSSLTTSQMMAVAQNAAPPPTLDMVNNSLQQTSINDAPNDLYRSNSADASSGQYPYQSSSGSQGVTSHYDNPVTNPFDKSPGTGMNPFNNTSPRPPRPPPASSVALISSTDVFAGTNLSPPGSVSAASENNLRGPFNAFQSQSGQQSYQSQNSTRGPFNNFDGGQQTQQNYNPFG